MSGGNLGSVPSRLIYLSDLPKCAPGDKVRFLGCVSHYDITTATLTLSHNYPLLTHPCQALTNIELLLNALASTDTQVGEWINVMGYVDFPSDTNGRPHCEAGPTTSHVQAVMLWPARSLKIGEYERALDERRQVDTRLSLRFVHLIAKWTYFLEQIRLESTHDEERIRLAFQNYSSSANTCIMIVTLWRIYRLGVRELPRRVFVGTAVIICHIGSNQGSSRQ